MQQCRPKQLHTISGGSINAQHSKQTRPCCVVQADRRGASPEADNPLDFLAAYSDAELHFNLQPPEQATSPSAMSLSLDLDSPGSSNMQIGDVTKDFSENARQESVGLGLDQHGLEEPQDELDTRQMFLQQAHDEEDQDCDLGAYQPGKRFAKCRSSKLL